MEKTITIKGTGKIGVKPDTAVVTMDIDTQSRDYDETMSLAAKHIDMLEKALSEVGFSKDKLKTTYFNVSAHYENYRDFDKNYKSEFDGYLCSQKIKLEFPLDTEKLSKVLSAITASNVMPRVYVNFSVSDKDAAYALLLKEATKNARMKAVALADASEVKLGNLLSIVSGESDAVMFSDSGFNAAERGGVMLTSAPNITPNDITLTEHATFVWEIL